MAPRVGTRPKGYDKTKPGRFPSTWFKVRPLYRSPKFFAVHLATTVAAMRREMRRCAGGCHSKQRGAVISVVSGTHPHCLGIIYLAKSRIGSAIVAHEMAHAAFRTMERVGMLLDTTEVETRWASTHPSEEQFCEIIGRLNSHFWMEFFRQERRDGK